jgi:hypothetical protein
MFVSVTGSGKVKRKMVDDLARFSLDLLAPRLVNKIEVDILLIHDLRGKEELAGDCTWEDSSYRPREFTVRVDSSQTPQEMLETVAHEIVHVKQFARGELQDLSRDVNLCKWQGSVIKCNAVHYYDLPWEIEAHGRERGLFIRWFEQSQWKNCKWAKY